MLQGAALDAGENGRVEQRTHHAQLALLVALAEWIGEVLAHEDDSATRATQCLVGGGGYDVGVFHGVVEQAGSDESGGMRHVDHEQCAHLVGNLAHALVVPLAAVGGAAADDEFGLMLQGQLFHLVVVHASCLLIEVVADGVVEDAGGVDLTAMRQVTTLVEVQAHKGIAGLQYGQQHCCVGLGARVGLHVGKLSAEELLHSLACEVFRLVHNLAAAIIAVAGQALGILVGHVGTHGAHHLVADEVLRCDKFHTLQLALMLLFNQIKDFLILSHGF